MLLNRRSSPAVFVVALLFATLTHVWAGESPTFYWQRLADLPQGVVKPAATISGNRLVVSGGLILGGIATDQVQVMDMEAQRWTHIVHLRVPRFGHAQVTLGDGRVLVVGGRTRDAQGRAVAIASCELIDPSGDVTITSIADLPHAIASPSLHLLSDGRIVAIGGHFANLYDPVGDIWAEPIRLTHNHNAHVSLRVNDRIILVMGGDVGRSIEVVDLLTRRAYDHPRVRLPIPMDDMAAVILTGGQNRGQIWVIGGQHADGHTVDQTWLLREMGSSAARIEPGPNLGLPAGISDHVLIETRYGLVIAGGESQTAGGQDTELAGALLLDPQMLSVQPLPAMDVPHDDAAAVGWAGTIIVLGGQAPGAMLGVDMPMPVSAVHLLKHTSDP